VAVVERVLADLTGDADAGGGEQRVAGTIGPSRTAVEVSKQLGDLLRDLVHRPFADLLAGSRRLSAEQELEAGALVLCVAEEREHRNLDHLAQWPARRLLIRRVQKRGEQSGFALEHADVQLLFAAQAGV